MNFLTRGYGGSIMYGLNSPESDIDYRGVYLSDDMNYILGLDAGLKNFYNSADEDRKDEKEGKEIGWRDDEVYYELRHFMRLLRKTNSVTMELLFNTNWLVECLSWRTEIAANRNKLIDKDQFFNSLTGGDEKDRTSGYIGNEIRLMLGERTGQLGGKRKAALDKYGFSYKNACQALRLVYAAKEFFESGWFPTDFTNDPNFGLVKDVKFNPEKYSKDQVEDLVKAAREELCEAYDNSEVETIFCEDTATKICHTLYKPIIDSWCK